MGAQMHNNFHETLCSHGLNVPPVTVTHDRFTRWGKNNRNWAKAVDDGYIFGCWAEPYVSSYWFPESDSKLSKAELIKRKKRIVKEREKLQKERLEGYLEIAAQASREYEQFSSDCSSSQYLKAKKVFDFGIKREGKNIIIPARDINDKLWTYQIIASDGRKLFKKGGKKRGCFHIVGALSLTEPIYICEGYATAASLHVATGYTAIVAFDANNIDPVITAFRRKYPQVKLVIAADNDRWKLRNAGKAVAEAARLKHGVKYIIPIFDPQFESQWPTDFNDLHVLQGADEIRRQLSWI